MEKELKDISWQVSESVYRQDPALSYSNLSTFEGLGFNGLDHLFDRKETPSLTLGSAVDSIITGGIDEFNERFIVLDVNISDSGKDICNKLLSMNLPFENFKDIPEQIVSEAAKEVGFWENSKWDKRRYSEVLKTGNIAEYYRAISHTSKTIIDRQTYEDVCNCVRALRESPSTSMYFAEDELVFSPVRRYYQLKFKGTFNGVDYRGMMDLIIVDYEKKIIYPCDLKTASTTEWDFELNFVKYHYYTQARTYWRLIRHNLDQDSYFKDFKLENFRFIVVNKKTLTPLVWEFPLTKEYGTLVDDKGNEYRDPFEIGSELRSYLDCRPQVPNGIVLDGVNVINCMKKPNA